MGVYKLSANSVKNGRTIYGSMLAGNTTYTSPSFDSIATVTIGSGGASNVEFTSIPGTYAHLQIRILARSTRTTSETDYMNVTVNSDTGANYSYHYLEGNGTSIGAGSSLSLNQMYSSYIGSDGASNSSIFGANVIDILDYSSANKNKTFRFLGGMDNNGTGGKVAMMSGLWMNSSTAISSIKFTPSTGSFKQYSSFALYGIKAV
jgi:hypothetical protein